MYTSAASQKSKAPGKHTVQSKQGARASLRVTPGLKGRTKWRAAAIQRWVPKVYHTRVPAPDFHRCVCVCVKKKKEKKKSLDESALLLHGSLLVVGRYAPRRRNKPLVRGLRHGSNVTWRHGSNVTWFLYLGSDVS